MVRGLWFSLLLILFSVGCPAETRGAEAGKTEKQGTETRRAEAPRTEARRTEALKTEAQGHGTGAVSLNLHEVRIVDLFKAVYSDILKRDYFLDPVFLRSPEVVTLVMNGASPDSVAKRLDVLVAALGFRVRHVDGLAIVDRAPVAPVETLEDKKPELPETLIYRPKYRTARYLQDLLTPLVASGGGSFGTQRMIRQSASALPSLPAGSSAAGISAGSSSVMQSKSDASSPTSAFGLTDKVSDVVVFSGSAAECSRLRYLFDDLDVPAADLLVKAVVYEVRKDRKDGNAVDLALGLLSSVKGFGFEISNGADQKNALKIKYGDVNAVWSALSSDVRFRLVSSPSLRVRSGATARFMTGQEVPVLDSVSYEGSSGTPIRSVKYKPSGVILDLMPDARADGSIDLDIQQQISSFVQTTTGVNDSPTLLKRELKTAVTLSGDELVLLGGLDESKNEESVSGISFLPAFLRGSAETEAKTEILMLLHVHKI